MIYKIKSLFEAGFAGRSLNFKCCKYIIFNKGLLENLQNI